MKSLEALKNQLIDLISNQSTLEEIEKAYILFIYAATGNNKNKSSKILGVGRRTLYRKLEVMGVTGELFIGAKVELASGEKGEVLYQSEENEDWYLVKLENNAIGSYHKDLIKLNV